jgi:tetratricopeptide (TPR) repeat protein
MAIRGVRKAGRVAFFIAALGLLVIVVIAVVRLLAAPPSSATKQDLAVVQTVAAAFSAIAAVSGALLARPRDRTDDGRLQDALTPHLLDDERLINRTAEMRDLVACIDDSRAVGCHGPRGAGKSFLLEHLTDVINGYRSRSVGQSRPKRVAAALYFDLADAVGFPEAQAQICHAVLGNPAATWAEFALSVERAYKRRRVVLILDNVNSEGIWRQLGQAARQYCAIRPQDRLVFGSIDEVVLSNLKVTQVEVLGLDLDATEELAAARGFRLTHEELVTLHRDWEGLPFYVCYQAAQDQRLIPDLPAETRRLVAYAALLAVVVRRINFGELRGSGVADMEKHVQTAVDRGILTRLPEGKSRRYKIHDIYRDAVLRELGPEVKEVALALVDRTYRTGELEHAALLAMFADPEQIETIPLDHLLEQVIGTAIQSKNYALIGSLHTRASENSDMTRFISRDDARADLFCFARASELAGLGHYEEAEEEILTSTVVRTRWQPGSASSELQANLRFLQADIAHLLNRYDESVFMFEELGEWAAIAGRDGLRARCVWGQGHALRHQGRDFERALQLLDQAAFLAENAGEPFAKAYAVCNANGIKVLNDAVPDGEEDRLAAIELEVAGSSAQSSCLLEVWKTQAQLAWWRGDRQRASEIVKAATERALELNDRLLYNLYFERAEFQRLTDAPEAAIDGYRAVLEFGTGNRDRNLISQALLGLVLAEIGSGQWLQHGTRDDARASLLRARRVALDADIQLTAQIAEQVTAMLDAEDPSSEDIRLFLL